MKFVITIIMFLVTILSEAQNVTITPSGITPEQVISRLTTAQRTLPTFQNAQNAGKLVFDIDNGQLYLWDGAFWKRIESERDGAEIPSFERTNNNEEGNDNFGDAVAISGEWAIIGAPRQGTKGEAYIFRRTINSWKLQKKLCFDLINSLVSDGAKFGTDVDIDIVPGGPVVVVGAPEQGGVGKAYVFRYKTVSGITDWVFEPATGTTTPLSHPSPLSGDQFGFSVAIEDNYIIVGAPFDDVFIPGLIANTPNAGSATIFKTTNHGTFHTWAGMGIGLGPTIQIEYTSTGAHAGWDVDITENYINLITREYSVIVGVPHVGIFAQNGVNTNPGYKGRADLYILNNTSNAWVISKNFTKEYLDNINYNQFSIGSANDNFHIGNRVELKNRILIIGAPGFQTNINPFSDQYTYKPNYNCEGKYCIFRTDSIWAVGTIKTSYGRGSSVSSTKSKMGRFFATDGKYILQYVIDQYNDGNGTIKPPIHYLTISEIDTESTSSGLEFISISKLIYIRKESSLDYEITSVALEKSGNFIFGKKIDNNDISKVVDVVNFGNINSN